jgi:hypothetical protein
MIKKFQVGKTYHTTTIFGTHKFTVVKRTKKMVTLANSEGTIIGKRSIDIIDDEEVILGAYAEAPVLRASKEE